MMCVLIKLYGKKWVGEEINQKSSFIALINNINLNIMSNYPKNSSTELFLLPLRSLEYSHALLSRRWKLCCSFYLPNLPKTIFISVKRCLLTNINSGWRIIQNILSSCIQCFSSTSKFLNIKKTSIPLSPSRQKVLW